MQRRRNRSLVLNEVLICSIIALSLAEANVDCYKQSNLNGSSLEVCLGRIPISKAGDSVTLDLSVDDDHQVYTNESNKFDFDIHVEQDRVVQAPNQVSVVTYGGKGTSKLLLQGTGKVGKTLVSLHCVAEENNTINTSCQLSEETLRFLRREAVFVHYLELNVVIEVIGWVYCIVWIFGFYPQIVLNCRRNSVVGLNFNFLALNLTGGLAYAMFNIGLFWIPQVKNEYFVRHPAGVNPVLLNDVVFSVNAAVAQTITIIQYFILKNENQKLSYLGIVFLMLLWLALIVPIGVSAAGYLPWLDYLYIISYVKLAVTPIKYIPQVFSNFKHKSTEGLSVGYVLLELIGGTFSVLQMFLLAYNFDDWQSIFGDPTKFGLGMISIVFDMIFLFQHWVLYRGARMREHRLHLECKCSNGVNTTQCKCAVERKRSLSSVVALPDYDIVLLKNPKTIYVAV